MPAPRRGGNIPHVRALGNATTRFQPATRTVISGTNSSPNTWSRPIQPPRSTWPPDQEVVWTFGGPHPFYPDVSFIHVSFFVRHAPTLTTLALKSPRVRCSTPTSHWKDQEVKIHIGCPLASKETSSPGCRDIVRHKEVVAVVLARARGVCF